MYGYTLRLVQLLLLLAIKLIYSTSKWLSANTFFVLYVGLRYNVGIDMLSYYNVYSGDSHGFRDILFTWIISLSQPFGFSFYFYCCVFHSGSVVRLTLPALPLPYISLLILSSNFLLYYGFSGIRQGLALSIVSFALTFKHTSKRYICFILVFLMYIHLLYFAFSALR